MNERRTKRIPRIENKKEMEKTERLDKWQHEKIVHSLLKRMVKCAIKAFSLSLNVLRYATQDYYLCKCKSAASHGLHLSCAKRTSHGNVIVDSVIVSATNSWTRSIFLLIASNPYYLHFDASKVWLTSPLHTGAAPRSAFFRLFYF